MGCRLVVPCVQLGYEGARQLQHKLGVFFAGFDVERDEFDPPMD